MGALEGKNIVITGRLPFKRVAVVKDIEAAGGTVQKAVTKSTDFLVVGDVRSTGDTQKLHTAREYGVRLITYHELRVAMDIVEVAGGGRIRDMVGARKLPDGSIVGDDGRYYRKTATGYVDEGSKPKPLTQRQKAELEAVISTDDRLFDL